MFHNFIYFQFFSFLNQKVIKIVKKNPYIIL
nr:MAG TPA: hypothetical protein [Caudoviricetes sp.]